jgi:cytochrome P450
MSERKPVTDWANDFDIFDPIYVADPYPIFAGLRASGCPIAHTDRFNGVSIPLTWDAVREIAYDTGTFSSYRLMIREKKRDDNLAGGNVPPLTSDPPEHRAHRLPLIAPLLPAEVEKLRPSVQAICNALIDGFADKGAFDASDDYAKNVATRAVASLMGLPEADGGKFHDWLHRFFVDGAADANALKSVYAELSFYMLGLVFDRKKNPRDDIVSYLTQAEFNGEKLRDEYVAAAIRVILFAGIDTTWSAIGAALWHLATHPDDQTRLRNDPDLMPTAIEELLRAYAPVSVGRLIKADATVAGCPLKAGEMVLLSYPSANRDPAKFENPDVVMLDRKENPHAAFGFGIHRCVGAHLARMEMTVAIETLLARIPSFRIAPGKEAVWQPGMLRGPRTVPLVFG